VEAEGLNRLIDRQKCGSRRVKPVNRQTKMWKPKGCLWFFFLIRNLGQNIKEPGTAQIVCVHIYGS
jgi:hypothetical protein